MWGGGGGRHQVGITNLDGVVREDLNAKATFEERCGESMVVSHRLSGVRELEAEAESTKALR